MQHIQLDSKYYYSCFLQEEPPNQKDPIICRRAENQWKRWDCRSRPPESKASAFHTKPSYSSWGLLMLIRPCPSSLVMTSVILFIEVKYTHRKVLVPYRYSLMDFSQTDTLPNKLAPRSRRKGSTASPKVPSHSSPVGNPYLQGNHYILTSAIERFPSPLCFIHWDSYSLLTGFFHSALCSWDSLTILQIIDDCSHCCIMLHWAITLQLPILLLLGNWVLFCLVFVVHRIMVPSRMPTS